jgi:integrase
VKKPLNWPRYMVERRLTGGRVAYYWTPRRKDLDRGLGITGEALGDDYAGAIARAEMLNGHLDAWRQAKDGASDPESGPRFGTLKWVFAQYIASAAFERVSERTRPVYLRALRQLEEVPTKDNRRVGDLAVEMITPRAVDKIYAALVKGPRGRRVRQADISINVARRAWDVVRRLYSKTVPLDNPFRGVMKVGGSKTKVAATRAEVYALAEALRMSGHPHLGAAALICFEWLQRPENVIAGKITWADYRPDAHPRHVRIFHHKTGEEVLQPLEENGRPLYPDLEAYLRGLKRLPSAIVLRHGRDRATVPYTMNYAAACVRKARAAAGLPEHVTLDACRHGGMTELGDAELAEQGVMALSGHRTPKAARLYIKRTDRQRSRAAAKRRAWVEESLKKAGVEMKPGSESRNELAQTIQAIEIIGAGEGNRTLDTQLGKLMFCH